MSSGSARRGSGCGLAFDFDELAALELEALPLLGFAVDLHLASASMQDLYSLAT